MHCAQYLLLRLYDWAMKWCSGCQQWKEHGEFYRNKAQPDGLQVQCKDCRWKIERGRREKSREYERQYRLTHPSEEKERHRRAYRADPAGHYQKVKEYRARQAAQVFEHYGTMCVCCGSTERLTIDHVDGNGAEHRADLFGSPLGNADGTYRWLIKNNFPSGFQTLCGTCNQSKRRGPKCRIHFRCPCCGTLLDRRIV